MGAYIIKNGVAYGVQVDAYTKAQTDALLSEKLDKSGATMSGTLDMGRNRIAGLAEAVNDGDAVNKAQMDAATAYPANRRLELIDLGTFASGSEFQSWYSSSGLKEDISSGAFKKALVGVYLTINDHVYYFAHPDYWYRTGDTECTKHHMLVVPAGNISSGKMNSTNITTGAYIGSDMYTGNNDNTALADAKAIIRQDFGADNILTHREHFQNAVTNGYESGGSWYDSDIDLMTERMVYGCDIFHNSVAGTNWANRYSIDKTQLKLFAERPDLITTRANWWLRDVAYAYYFAIVAWHGGANSYNASDSIGVRPAFAIC